MGIVFITGKAQGPRKSMDVKFLVDSGATYTLLEKDVWEQIGLTPKRTASFTLADGSHIERQVSECYISLPQGDGHSPVILGEVGDESLLGVITLENLGLILNPFKRTLQPARLLLA